MGYKLEPFAGVGRGGLTEALLGVLLDEHGGERVPRLARLWRYYRNPLELTIAGKAMGLGDVGAFGPVYSGEAPAIGGAGSPRYRQAQEEGLPARTLGHGHDAYGGVDGRAASGRREVVIENDIGWRVQTMVDFMFGKPPRLVSTAADEGTRHQVERLLDAVWEASGGIQLLQDIATMGAVYGYVDLVLRIDELALISDAVALGDALASGSIDELAELIRIEPVEPRRGVPLVSDTDYRRLDAYAIHFERELSEVEADGESDSGGDSGRSWWDRVRGNRSGGGPGGGLGSGGARRPTRALTELLGPGVRQVYDGGELSVEEASVLLPGALPVVHIQNLSQPFVYEGMSEVEPLIPLQDELNTRLSDRASRVTMQSFKMYLAKGLEGFGATGVGPGQVWATDNPEASVTAFGGDASSPSEDAHIAEIREAMDKVSAVPPLAGGVVRAKIGNLSSANALRITLQSLIAKTERKRVTYGRGIAQISRMILTALDAAGVLRTGPWDRGVEIAWRDPQPTEVLSDLRAAQAKLEVGVPGDRVLAELGYGSEVGGGDGGVH